MNSNVINTEKNLKESIEKFYGFKQHLIKNPEQCGMWHVRFEVNGIKYYGSIAYNGALPTLKVEGYTTKYYYKDTPLEDWYYIEYIKEKSVKIIKRTDPDQGDWEDTEIRCNSEGEAKEMISHMSNPEKYWYDLMD